MSDNRCRSFPERKRVDRRRGQRPRRRTTRPVPAIRNRTALTKQKSNTYQDKVIKMVNQSIPFPANEFVLPMVQPRSVFQMKIIDATGMKAMGMRNCFRQHRRLNLIFPLKYFYFLFRNVFRDALHPTSPDRCLNTRGGFLFEVSQRLALFFLPRILKGTSLEVAAPSWAFKANKKKENVLLSMISSFRYQFQFLKTQIKKSENLTTWSNSELSERIN